MALRLLGPLGLTVGDSNREIGGTRQRIVLAALALNANRITPIEHLVDAVWEDSPPTTARAQVQICVSALRRVLTGTPIQIRTRPPGYVLDIPDSELDTEQFTRLVAAARAHADAGSPGEAVAALRGALSLWRGPALVGMDSEPLRREAVKLDDARLGAITARIRLDLVLGRHDEVIGELSALVTEHPLSERLHEFLMLALYRSGRQAEALEVCRRVRMTLVDELGIEPGPSMRRLELAILNRDPALDLPSTPPGAGLPTPVAADSVVPRRLPGTIADFTGREAQLAEITRVLSHDGCAGGRYGMRIVAISGMGGVGKSTLAVRAAHELGDVFPDGHLYGDLDTTEGEDRVRGMVARFLRALGINGSAVPDDEEERAELYRSLLARRRALIVLDNVSNEKQVFPLLPAGPGCAVIVTSRAPMSGLPGAHQVDLDVFDENRSLEMLTRIVGQQRVAAEPDAAHELVTLCGGLPLAIRIAGARLALRPHWRTDNLVARLRDTPHRLDELSYRGLGLRSSINLSYRTLSPDGRRLFQLLSIITTADFPCWTAAALLDMDPFRAAEVLESLVEAQLLDTVQYPGERLRYRFHDLVRVFAAEQLGAETSEGTRRAATARLLGSWLAGAEAAHRKGYGGDYTTLHGSSPRGLVPDEFGEFDDPMEWLEAERQSLVAAVYLAASAGMAELCWDLALTLVTLFEVKGYFDDWRNTTQAALAAAEQAGDRRGRAAMLYSLGTLHLTQRRLAEAVPCFAEALEIFEDIGDVHGRALVRRNATTVDRLLNRDVGINARYEVALAMMREVGDVVGEAHILQQIAKVRIDGGEPERHACSWAPYSPASGARATCAARHRPCAAAPSCT